MKYILLISVCVFFSCQKTIQGDRTNANAKVIWTGSIETDGCGWTLQINDKLYHPETLSEDFQQNQLNVIVNYETTKAIFPCGITNKGLPVIQIMSIRKE